MEVVLSALHDVLKLQCFDVILVKVLQVVALRGLMHETIMATNMHRPVDAVIR